MTKCLKWLPGQGQATAALADIRELMALNADIEPLESRLSATRMRPAKSAEGASV